MNLIEFLTPKDTEEIKPGLYLQHKKNKRGILRYNQVYPSAWDGKIIWKNLLWGGSISKGLVWFLILMFLVWSYQHDVKTYKDFYENRFEFCAANYIIEPEPASFVNFTNFVPKIQNETKNTYPLQNLSG